MRDSEVVAAIVAGDHAALAEAYDRYAPGLHSYCRSLTDQPADAAGAVQDTFVIAASRLSGLRDPGRRRSWLYAVARNECHRRLRAGAGHAPLEAAQDVPDESADVSAGAERSELRALVSAALGGVSQAHRDPLHLQLRQGLDPGEIADVLGVSRNHAHALLSRARDQLELSLGVLLVARTGRGDCPELDAMLRGWDGRLTVLLRKRLNRHLEHCAICGVRKHRELKPGALEAAAIPPAALPAGLRRQTIDAATSADQGAVLHRLAMAKLAGPFSHGGWPRRRAPEWWHRHRVHVSAAGTAVGAGAVAAVVLAGGGPNLFVVPHGPSAVVPLPGASGRVRPGASPGTTAGSAGPGARRTGGGTGTATATGACTATGPGRPQATGPVPTLPPPSPTVQASTGAAQVTEGTVSVSPSTLTLTPLTGSAFTITAHGGPVSWSVSPAASLIGNVTASPASGTLTPDQSVTVTVTAASLLTVASQLTVNPGGHVVTVLAGL